MNQTKQTEEHEDCPIHLQKEGKSCVIGFGIPNHLREVRKQQLYCSRPTVPHHIHLLQQLEILNVCYRFTFFCLLIKKWVFFFNSTAKNEVEQNELRFRRTSQAAILAQLPSRQTFFSEAGFTLGRRLSCIERRKSHIHQRASMTPSVIFFFESSQRKNLDPILLKRPSLIS